MTWLDFLIIGFLGGTSCGLVLSMLIEKFIDMRFKKEKAMFKKSWEEQFHKE
ncbi:MULTISPECIES: hypothetical protein [Bacillus]|uniref:hypothetical protein n=1 Tax=Bacillus TaxID=1386 RepID=UPI0012B68256|nr:MULTISPECIES: hypothetical protein [Bacillus]